MKYTLTQQPDSRWVVTCSAHGDVCYLDGSCYWQMNADKAAHYQSSADAAEALTQALQQ